MKKLTLLLVLISAFAKAQSDTVWLKDHKGKVLVTTTEQRLPVVVDSLYTAGKQPRTVERWLEGRATECKVTGLQRELPKSDKLNSDQ